MRRKLSAALLFGFLVSALEVHACQVQFTGPAAQMFGSTPRGNFPDINACESYRLSRPGFEANNSRCVGCTAGGSSFGGGFSGGNFQQQLMYGLFQSFMNGLIQGMQQPSQPQGPSPAEIAKQRQLAKETEARWQERVKKQIDEMRHAYAEQKQQEFARKKSALLADLMPAEGLPGQGLSGRSKALQQACMISLQLEAAKALSRGEDELFDRYRKLYDQVEAGDLASCPDSLARLPEPTPAPAEQDIDREFHSNFSEMVLNEINMRLPLIHQAREERQKAREKVAELEARVEELQAKRQAPQTGTNQEAAEEDLLAQAMQELEKAKELERKADEDLNRLNRELEALEKVKTAANAERKPAKEAKP